MKDALGDRMKQQYENTTRYYLPRRTYTILRLDGRAFHTYTQGFERPFDPAFAFEMDTLAINLCGQVQGAVFAYVQSDEVSLLLQDFATLETQPWLGGNIQKMVSVAASYAGRVFGGNVLDPADAHFDARVFTIPDQVEVGNYLIWRQRDAVRNSILMAAQAAMGHSACQGLNTSELQEKMFQECQINWNDYPPGFKRGRLVTKKQWSDGETITRTEWHAHPAPTFSFEDGGFLNYSIPEMPRINDQRGPRARRQS